MVDPSRRKYISQRTFETRSTSLSLTIMHSCQMKKKVMLWNVRGSPVYQNCQSELGASVETIVSSLTVKMPTKEVEKILEFLASEGHVYSPSDDRHYKATDSFN
ncbi:replication protein A 32 kDa subunit-B-like isoform X2 [Homalodisca vitripennis]|uniref:replication protein A 32 kDa subunit-B-like isoform X2 n=1 Tax=Homalodisca vitripennis TaxID=197043 RepID=UPI001EEB2F2A|nr:replication protein A 32 kDa subunit-B-like isoform X2 [Homalodisca vitripennis]